MPECMDWMAWYDRMPGSADGTLRVAGKCKVSSSSTQLRLEQDNEGIVPDPELVVLRLVVEEAAVGDTMMSTKDVSIEIQESGVKRVLIRIPDADDVRLDVQDVH